MGSKISPRWVGQIIGGGRGEETEGKAGADAHGDDGQGDEDAEEDGSDGVVLSGSGGRPPGSASSSGPIRCGTSTLRLPQLELQTVPESSA